AQFHLPLQSLTILLTAPSPQTTLFPYTTLFRSRKQQLPLGLPSLSWVPFSFLFTVKHICSQFSLARAPRNTLQLATSKGDHRQIDRKSTRLNSSHVSTSYAVFCLKEMTKQRITL